MMLETKVQLKLDYEEKRALREAQAIIGQIYDLCEEAEASENFTHETDEIYKAANNAYSDIGTILGYIPEDYT